MTASLDTIPVLWIARYPESGRLLIDEDETFMKSRLETPLLAAGRKAGPPKAGNQWLLSANLLHDGARWRAV